MKTLLTVAVFLTAFLHQSTCCTDEKNATERVSEDSHTTEPTCSLSSDLIKEVESYGTVINDIMNTALNGSFKGKTWEELSRFVDEFGPRFTGTQNLENSINYVMDLSRNYSLDNIHGEAVTVPQWIRGEESATLILPRRKKLAMLGLGYSVGTPEEGITAKAIVVNNFDELKARADEVSGKIVVYNEEYVGYSKTVKYRSKGAIEAAKYGAVAVLIRSITPFSLYTPHTGMMDYEENVPKIPSACITIEDASLLRRLDERGKTIQIHLKMQAKRFADVQSQNLIAELKGSEHPEKVVLVSGHIDSWDVGQGAVDDGGGAFISWGALALLKSLNLRPKRTIRLIMWTAEEMGIIGARHYIKQHEADINNLQLVMESDIGTFLPLGLEVTASDNVNCILKHILSLMKPLGDLKIRNPQQGPDIDGWVKKDVPGASLWNENDKYFWYHHTEADSMVVEDPKNLDIGTALFAAVSYVAADLSLDFPRNTPLQASV